MRALVAAVVIVVVLLLASCVAVPGETPESDSNLDWSRDARIPIDYIVYAISGTIAGEVGNIVSGPDDALCGTVVGIGEKAYILVCVMQTVQPSLPNIQFPGNSVQRDFPDGSGANQVVLPN